MKKINVIGEMAKYTFINTKTGEKVIEYNTAEDYNTRIAEDRPPKKDGYDKVVWSRITRFDTSDGKIHDSEYALSREDAQPDGEEKDRIFLKLPGQSYMNLGRNEAKKIKAALNEIPDEDLI